MSVCYSTIAFGASVAAVGKTGPVSHTMRPGSTADRLFGVMNAIGEPAFLSHASKIMLDQNGVGTISSLHTACLRILHPYLASSEWMRARSQDG